MSLSLEIETAIQVAVAREVKRQLPPQRERYLTVKESSGPEYLNCHTDTVLRLVKAGELRSVGSGKMLRIPVSAISECLANRAAKKAARERDTNECSKLSVAV